jgi:hypothetical protein
MARSNTLDRERSRGRLRPIQKMTDPFSPGPSNESLRPFSVQVRQFPIFVSYGDDAMALKIKVKRLVEDAINRQLSHSAWATQLVVWDWRDIAARRAPAGGRTNDIFVEMVRASSVTIVLLFDRLPLGSKEELLAAVEEDEVDLKVFWLNRRRWWRRSSEVGRFLDAHSDRFDYLELSELDSDDTWVALTNNLVAVLLAALRGNQRTPYLETRGTL